MARPKRTSVAKKTGNQTVKTTPVKAAEVKEAEEQKVEEMTTEAVETEKKAEEIIVSPAEATEESVTEPKKKGRKPGTKNKVKAEPVAEVKGENVFVELDGRQFKTEEVLEKVRTAWVAEGHRAGNIKKLDVYINMNEFRAYYVINEKNTGSIEL